MFYKDPSKAVEHLRLEVGCTVRQLLWFNWLEMMVARILQHK